MFFFAIVSVAFILVDVYIVRKLKKELIDLSNRLSSIHDRNDKTLICITNSQSKIEELILQLGDCEEARKLNEAMENQKEMINKINRFYK
jgi:hypothetical protein